MAKQFHTLLLQNEADLGIGSTLFPNDLDIPPTDWLIPSATTAPIENTAHCQVDPNTMNAMDKTMIPNTLLESDFKGTVK